MQCACLNLMIQVAAMAEARWLTIDQAAKRVHRSERTIRRWISDGLLRRFPDGRVRAEHLLDVDQRMRANVGGRPKGDTVPLLVDGREVGHITIAPDGAITGRIRDTPKP